MDKGIDHVKIQVNKQRLEHLHLIHEYMIAAYVPENNYEHLLHAHLTEMYWRLEEMVNHAAYKQSKKSKWTIKVSAAQAMAFCLLWGNEKFDMRQRGAFEVTEVIKQIDKESKNVMRYAE